MKTPNFFRLWFKTHGYFVTGNHVTISPDGDIMSYSNDYDHDANGDAYHWHNYDYEDKDNYVVQLFSGFYDIHGTPIYEGDILCYRINLHGKQISYKVILENGIFKGEEGDYLTDLSDPECPNTLNDEIIGNIFENPELIDTLTK